MSRPAPTFPRTTLLAGLIFVCLHLAANAQRTIRVPADQPTVQAAINAAATGDTVLVAPGTYYENLTIDTRQITLTSSDGVSKTILDGSSSGIVLKITNNTNLNTTVSGFTIQNGLAGSSSDQSGAGIQVGRAGATISGNVFRNNTGGSQSPSANINVYAGVIHALGNVISTSPHAGAAACVGIDGVDIVVGGPVNNADGSSAITMISGNTIEGDGSRCSGTGILTSFAGDQQIDNNVLNGNLYGMVINGGRVVVRQNLVYNNVSGGIQTTHDPGELFGHNTDPADYFIISNTLFNNLTNPLSTSSADLVVSGAPAKASIVNNVVVGTTAHPVLSCSSAFSTAGDTPLILDHNDLFNTSGGPLTGGVCTDPTGSYGNISADPHFTSATDLHLLPGSPAIDAGNNSAPYLLATDLGNTPRLQDSTGKGYPVVDMGAYESPGLQPEPATALTLASSAYYELPGPITLTANLVSAGLAIPGVPFSFVQDGNPIGVSNSDAGGNASFTTPSLPPGVHAFTATYPGQGSFAPAVSVVLYVFVDRYPVTLTLASSTNPSGLNQPVTFTTHISSPDGAVLSPVQLLDNGSPLTFLTIDGSGSATYTTTALSQGSYSITGSFAGDTTHGPATASLSQQVTGPPVATATSLVIRPSPSLLGQPLTLTASVAAASTANGVPTGTISFSEGTQILGTQALTGGTASLTLSSLGLGSHSVTAAYTPSGPFLASASGLANLTVLLPTASTLTSSANPSPATQTLNLTARVTSPVTSIPYTLDGAVTFTDNGVALGTQPVINSAATLSTASLTIGRHTVVATYNPTSANPYQQQTSASIVQTVTGQASAVILVASPNPAAALAPVTLTVNASIPNSTGAPTGTVTLFDAAAPLVTLELNPAGSAAFTTNTLSSGTHLLHAVYNGSTTVETSTSASVSETVLAAPTSITITAINPLPALVRQPITLAAHVASAVTGTPSGTVLFHLGAAILSVDLNAAGDAVITTSPDLIFLPTGLTAGTFPVSATYTGSTAFAPSTSATLSETTVLNPTTTTLAAAPSPATQGQAVSVLATVSTPGVPPVSGTVTFFEGATLLGTSPTGIGGRALLNLPGLSVGQHNLTAVFATNAVFSGSASTSALNLTVLPSDFTLSTPTPSLTLTTEHHGPMALSLASVGSFTDRVNLSCGPLPDFATCAFDTPPSLTSGSAATTTLHLDTDAILNFVSADNPPRNPTAPAPRTGLITALATTLPLGLLSLLAVPRRRLPLRLLALLLAASATLTLASGCSGKYPGHTPPGTYTINVTAVGQTTHVTHTTPITLIVTE